MCIRDSGCTLWHCLININGQSKSLVWCLFLLWIAFWFCIAFKLKTVFYSEWLQIIFIATFFVFDDWWTNNSIADDFALRYQYTPNDNLALSLLHGHTFHNIPNKVPYIIFWKLRNCRSWLLVDLRQEIKTLPKIHRMHKWRLNYYSFI